MKLNQGAMTLLPGMLAASLACAAPAQAQSATTAPDNAPFNVAQLFATTCGFCHSDGGRAAGKGPRNDFALLVGAVNQGARPCSAYSGHRRFTILSSAKMTFAPDELHLRSPIAARSAVAA
jgi:hypothetical protein